MRKLWETVGWKLFAALGSIAFAMSSWALAAVVDLKVVAAKYQEHAEQQVRRENEEGERLVRIENKIDALLQKGR
jgi:hypothetical protein